MRKVKRIWFVEDPLSKNVLDDTYYSNEAEAVDFQNRLGCGVVKSYELPDGGYKWESTNTD